MAALKNLGLNIKRAKLKQAGESGGKHKFYVTESGALWGTVMLTLVLLCRLAERTVCW